MPQIIASTYEIIREIGSGGGGIVYLGRHMRLGKKIVLKADKRTLSAKEETLRREVDALKNLNQTYIPQVYDFIQQDGVVYTVMDYIEGESLDKPLKRRERFEQSQIVNWSCELLEALCYLHSRPPYGILHSDIKPANIMLTPEGDIRLIDFNIALALGEEGAVRVGYSQGYASPEHYGLDYSGISQTRGLESGETEVSTAATQLPTDPGKTELSDRPSSSGSTGSGKGIMLDVRSDIYSLGATLYHLLLGRRPAQDAKDVKPILPVDGVSPAVAAIINKAMQPAPEDRYQTAAEMLWDFEHLHENDPRTKRLKRQRQMLATALSVLLLSGGAMTLAGNTQMRHAEEEARIVAEQKEKEERIAKEKEENAKIALELKDLSLQALAAGDRETAIENALISLKKDTQYNAAAQYALTNALGVYELKDGYKTDKAITLPGEVIKQTVSANGRFAAVLAAGKIHIIDLFSGELIEELSVGTSALSGMLFTPKGMLLYTGEDTLKLYDPTAKTEVWHVGVDVIDLTLSADGLVAAAIRSDGSEALVFDVENGEIRSVVPFAGLRRNGPVNAIFADPEDDVFTLDATGRYLAVSFSNGALKIFDTDDSEQKIDALDDSDYLTFEGGFFEHFFGFVASNGTNSDFYVLNMDTLGVAGSLSTAGTMRLYVDYDGFCLAENGVLVRLDINTGNQTELAFTDSGIKSIARADGRTLIQTSDGKLLFYDENAHLFDRHGEIACDFMDIAGSFAVLSGRDSPTVRVLRLTQLSDHQLFTYDSDYVHDEARVSSDRKTVMLFDYRGFRLYTMAGNVIADQTLFDTENIFDQQYRRDDGGDYLEIIYYDGTHRSYSACDGSVISETQGDKPDRTLYQEFTTDRVRIEAPLHKAAEAYDLETGEHIRTLETEDHLVYVSQAGEYIITEYISSEGGRYGLLLNEQMETVAYLPGLCDILPDHSLVFDDMRGNLRESRIYSPQELTTLAENNLRR